MSFRKISLPLSKNPFDALLQVVNWEDQPKGRKIAVISRSTAGGQNPIVRTTSRYTSPAQPFAQLHETLTQQIQKYSEIDILELNHATCEIYDHRYRTMKYHTDQALDIASDSYICLFSCYEDGENETHPRTLKIKNKESNAEEVIVLSHKSCIIFSEAVNQAHVHKIEAAGSGDRAGGKWMGVTFRLSKTYVKFDVDGVPRFVASGLELRIADEQEQKEFCRSKGEENRRANYSYPDVDYTISSSDIMPLGLSPSDTPSSSG